MPNIPLIQIPNVPNAGGLANQSAIPMPEPIARGALQTPRTQITDLAKHFLYSGEPTMDDTAARDAAASAEAMGRALQDVGGAIGNVAKSLMDNQEDRMDLKALESAEKANEHLETEIIGKVPPAQMESTWKSYLDKHVKPHFLGTYVPPRSREERTRQYQLLLETSTTRLNSEIIKIGLEDHRSTILGMAERRARAGDESAVVELFTKGTKNGVFDEVTAANYSQDLRAQAQRVQLEDAATADPYQTQSLLAETDEHGTFVHWPLAPPPVREQALQTAQLTINEDRGAQLKVLAEDLVNYRDVDEDLLGPLEKLGTLSTAAKAGIQKTLSGDIPVGDETDLAFYQFLDRAQKYSPEGDPLAEQRLDFLDAALASSIPRERIGALLEALERRFSPEANTPQFREVAGFLESAFRSGTLGSSKSNPDQLTSALARKTGLADMAFRYITEHPQVSAPQLLDQVMAAVGEHAVREGSIVLQSGTSAILPLTSPHSFMP